MKLIWMNVSMTQRFGVVVFHRSVVDLWGSKLEVDSGSKLEGDSGSGSKLEGALLLGTRCHCMNTSSENMKLFHVFPLDVTCRVWGKLEGDSGSKLESDFSSGSKLEGNSGSKLEGALLLGTRCHH